jgi:phytoene dehydrogenase-like protein
MEEAAVSRLPGERMLVKDSEGEFTMAVAAAQSAPRGKRAVTFTCRTEVDSWFTYQTSEEDYEEWDQDALAQFWNRLHAALPELGSDIEIIETANPRTYYEQTRRKLGMVLGVDGASANSSRTFLPNLFITGDTVTATPTLDAVIEAAVLLATDLRG